MTDERIVELPYTADSMTLAARLRQLDCPVFLDSCRHNSPGERYDIMSALPLVTLQVAGGRLACSIPLPEPARQDVFKAVAYLLKYFAPAPAAAPESMQEGLPFNGGLLGFLGYPRLTGHGTWQIEEAFLGVYPWALIVDHTAQRCRLLFQPSCPDSSRAKISKALESPAVPATPFLLRQAFTADMPQAMYRSAFGRIKEYIDSGDVYQVNLTQRFSSRFAGDPFSAYHRLRQVTGKPFSAYLRWGDNALLSLSPERFLQVSRARVVTQPIKGTRPRARDRETDLALARNLLASEKDRAENLMIVDLLRNDLGAVCRYGSIRVDRLFELQSFDNVHHLVSTISGTLSDDISPLQLLQACFPGGSITGAPKIRAMEIIEELEPTPRNVYCGTVLYLGFNGNMDSNLTIRTLSCQADQVMCWAGGGVVADSEWQQEYAECFDKIRSIISVLER